MSVVVQKCCRECDVCHRCKLPFPQKAPLLSVPIGKPWEMVAIDVVEVPISYQNIHYLLVIQDYFTKWVEAIPMPDQTAVRLTNELVKLSSMLGFPQIVHSDQGRNFESTVLKQTLEAFGISKSRTIHRATAWQNVLTVHFCNYSVHLFRQSLIGRDTYHQSCMHTVLQGIHLLVFLPFT